MPPPPSVVWGTPVDAERAWPTFPPPFSPAATSSHQPPRHIYSSRPAIHGLISDCHVTPRRQTCRVAEELLENTAPTFLPLTTTIWLSRARIPNVPGGRREQGVKAIPGKSDRGHHPGMGLRGCESPVQSPERCFGDGSGKSIRTLYGLHLRVSRRSPSGQRCRPRR